MSKATTNRGFLRVYSTPPRQITPFPFAEYRERNHGHTAVFLPSRYKEHRQGLCLRRGRISIYAQAEKIPSVRLEAFPVCTQGTDPRSDPFIVDCTAGSSSIRLCCKFSLARSPAAAFVVVSFCQNQTHTVRLHVRVGRVVSDHRSLPFPFVG